MPKIEPISPSFLTPPTPLHKTLTAVRRSTARVLAQAEHVQVHAPSLRALAASMAAQLATTQPAIAWDSEGWHYQADVQEAGPRTCQYVL